MTPRGTLGLFGFSDVERITTAINTDFFGDPLGLKTLTGGGWKEAKSVQFDAAYRAAQLQHGVAPYTAATDVGVVLQVAQASGFSENDVRMYLKTVLKLVNKGSVNRSFLVARAAEEDQKNDPSLAAMLGGNVKKVMWVVVAVWAAGYLFPKLLGGRR